MAAAGSTRRTGGSKSKPSLCRLLLVHALLLVASSATVGGLQVGFYGQTCPQAEKIVQSVTWRWVAANRGLAGKLLRLYFHDCFPQGCDASLLLDAKGGEKAARQNLSLDGYDLVDDAKAELEKACPGTVSCADVLALAARDAVSLQFGGALWPVETGRLDSLFSDEKDATHLPHPRSKFQDLKAAFDSRGLSVADLVALSGAHTLGRAHCQFVSERLYNFTGSNNNGVDSTLDPGYAQQLKGKCPPNPPLSLGKLAMDPRSEFNFDTSYFRNLKLNKGLFHSDAALLRDPESLGWVDRMHDQGTFLAAFTTAIQKMGAYQVLTGNQGEVRTNCRVVN